MKRDPKQPYYDRKTKCITFEILFGADIQIRLKATREAWLDAWQRLDFDALTFPDVQPFLSRNPKQAVESLAEFSEKHQDLFGQTFLNCVIAANSQNPLSRLGTKPRGGSQAGLDWEARNKVSRLALKLEHVLRVMRGVYYKEWPTYFSSFHKRYFFSEEIKRPFTATEFPSVIAEALSNHFGIAFGANLYDTFVKKRGKKHGKKRVKERSLTLRRLEQRQCLLPLADPDLSELFSKFQK